MHTNLQLPAEMNHWVEEENRYSQESNALYYLDLLGSYDVMFPEQINDFRNVKANPKADLFMVSFQKKNYNMIWQVQEIYWSWLAINLHDEAYIVKMLICLASKYSILICFLKHATTIRVNAVEPDKICFVVLKSNLLRCGSTCEYFD